MSRHIFNTTYSGRPVEVAAGWDRPLQGYFLTVLYLDTPDDIDYEYAFNNLEWPNPHPNGFARWAATLDNMGIKIPDAMIEDIRADGRDNAGNKIRDWNKEAA